MAREQIVPGVLRLNNKLFFFCRCTIKNIYISSRCHFPSSNAKPALMWENLPMTHWCLLPSLLSGSTYSSRNCLEEIFLSDQRRSTSSSVLNWVPFKVVNVLNTYGSYLRYIFVIQIKVFVLQHHCILADIDIYNK